MTEYQKMFQYDGKTTKLIGQTRTKIYHEMYDHISEKQENSDLPFDGDYLGDNELAKTIYEKKYFLKDLSNKLIEKDPEDVFKRLASFLSTVEGTKTKQKQVFVFLILVIGFNIPKFLLWESFIS